MSLAAGPSLALTLTRLLSWPFSASGINALKQLWAEALETACRELKPTCPSPGDWTWNQVKIKESLEQPGAISRSTVRPASLMPFGALGGSQGCCFLVCSLLSAPELRLRELGTAPPPPPTCLTFPEVSATGASSPEPGPPALHSALTCCSLTSTRLSFAASQVLLRETCV